MLTGHERVCLAVCMPSLGVVNAARAAIDAGASRYLVISSGAVSRPDSFGYKVRQTPRPGGVPCRREGPGCV